MENNEISVIEALNHVQSWLNAGEYDKVIQGCQEILEIEPGNSRALALLRKAEERRHESLTQNPAQDEKPDPLASLQVEDNPLKPTDSTDSSDEATEKPAREGFDETEKRHLFLAMLIPAILVVVLGGGLIWFLANADREETIEDQLSDEDEQSEQDLSFLEDNDRRVSDMENILLVLEAYELKNGFYPSVSEVEKVLLESDLFEEIPSDPRQGDIDKVGKAFGYIYSVYDSSAGENTVFILSALFEGSDGFGTPWAQGAPIKNYPDYREYEQSNVTFIGGDEDEVEAAGKGLDLEEDEEDGPKVKPQ